MAQAPQAPNNFWWWVGFALTVVSTLIAGIRWYLSSKATQAAQKAQHEARKAKEEAKKAREEVRQSRETQ